MNDFPREAATSRVYFVHSDDYEELRAPAPAPFTEERVGQILFPGEVRTWGEIRFIAIPALGACLPRPLAATHAPERPRSDKRTREGINTPEGEPRLL